MANAPLTTVLRHIRKLAAVEHCKDLTDGQLLDNFSSSHDEVAFAVLVRRHGPLVLRVCRRVLHQEQDAEDAFQATFFVLARKAASIRKPETLVNWLHGVAYRTAMNAKRDAARRREHEARAKPSSDNLNQELAWRDVQAILEEEIHRLPEKYRAPFLLCCVEERSRAEVAHQLRLKEGTVWSRLSRARKLLQQQLAARGVEFSAVLAAIAIAEQPGRAGVPIILVKSTIRAALQYAAERGAATGIVSAKAAALANGVIRAMFTSKLKIATVLFLSTAAATGAGVLTYEAAPAQQIAAPQATVAKAARLDAPVVQQKEIGDQIVVSGRVLDPDGEPFEGAQLYLWTSGPQKPGARTERARTQKDGRFRFVFSKAERGSDAKVVASAKGFGPDWRDLGDAKDLGEITLRLAKDDVPIEGRVLDLEARPIADVIVEVSGLQQGDLKPWMEARQHGSYPDLPRRISPQALDGPSTVKTGKDGRFRLTGFGRDRVVQLKIHGENLESSTFWVMTRREAVPGLRTGHYGTYPASFDHLVNPAKSIVGTIRDKATGKPIAGITVASSMYHWVFGKSDEQGHYRLSGVGKHKEYTVSAGGAPYFNCTKMNVTDTPGLEPITVDFELERGVAIHGRLLDRVTGKPVSGHVGFMAAPDNPNLKNYSTLGGLQVIASNEGRTKSDGSFTVAAVPGPGLLTAMVFDSTNYLRAKLDGIKTPPNVIIENYHAVVPIDASEENPKSTICDVFVERGHSLAGSIVGPNGKPLPGALAAGLGDVPELFSFNQAKLPTASFTVGGLDAKRPRTLFFFHPEKKLAKLQTVPGDAAGPLTVQLEPLGSVTGRVLDAEGRPRPGLNIAVMHSYQRDDYNHLPLELLFEYPSWTKVIDSETTIDAEGRFHAEGLVPGLKYFLNVKDGQVILPAYTKENLKVQSGKTTDLGDLRDQKASDKGAK